MRVEENSHESQLSLTLILVWPGIDFLKAHFSVVRFVSPFLRLGHLVASLGPGLTADSSSKYFKEKDAEYLL